MSQVLVGILFWFFFLPFKLYFLWANYKGRFRYGLWEHSSFWRRLDKRSGVVSLLLEFLLTFMIVVVLSSLVVIMFEVPVETGLSFVLFGAIG